MTDSAGSSAPLSAPPAENTAPVAVRTAHRGATSAVADGWVAGGSFFGSIMAGALLGWLADRWLDTDPWLVVTGIVLGSVSGFIRMWELVGKPTGKQSVRGR